MNPKDFKKILSEYIKTNSSDSQKFDLTKQFRNSKKSVSGYLQKDKKKIMAFIDKSNYSTKYLLYNKLPRLQNDLSSEFTVQFINVAEGAKVYSKESESGNLGSEVNLKAGKKMINDLTNCSQYSFGSTRKALYTRVLNQFCGGSQINEYKILD